MTTETKPRVFRIENGVAGIIWLIGWLFTISYANLIW